MRGGKRVLNFQPPTAPHVQGTEGLSSLFSHVSWLSRVGWNPHFEGTLAWRGDYLLSSAIKLAERIEATEFRSGLHASTTPQRPPDFFFFLLLLFPLGIPSHSFL